MNLFAAFAETVARRRYHPAIFWGEAQLAYDWIAQRTAWLSRALTRDFGIQRGDRVAVWLKNCPEFPAAIFGVWRAGGVVTVINNFLKPEEVAFILADSGARIVITDGSLAENQAKLAALQPGLKFLRVEDFAALAEADAPLPADLNEADLAALLYTSGTTGRPKGVRREAPSPDQVAAMARNRAAIYGLKPGIRAAVPGPLYHLPRFPRGGPAARAAATVPQLHVHRRHAHAAAQGRERRAGEVRQPVQARAG